MNDPLPQLQMIWPDRLLEAPPAVRLPSGYKMNIFQFGDELEYFQLLEIVGWPDWDKERLRPKLSRVLPDGWFIIRHHETNQIVASAMSLHNYKEVNPFQGELGLLACHPDHRGKGLGKAAAAAVTARLIQAGYRQIHLYTEDFRLPAIKIYLILGYVPYLYLPEMGSRWQAICHKLKWSYTLEDWIS